MCSVVETTIGKFSKIFENVLGMFWENLLIFWKNPGNFFFLILIYYAEKFERKFEKTLDPTLLKTGNVESWPTRKKVHSIFEEIKRRLTIVRCTFFSKLDFFLPFIIGSSSSPRPIAFPHLPPQCSSVVTNRSAFGVLPYSRGHLAFG